METINPSIVLIIIKNTAKFREKREGRSQLYDDYNRYR